MNVLSRYASILNEVEAFYAACERPLPYVVRVNTVKTSVSSVVEALKAEQIACHRVEWDSKLLELETDSPGATWPYFVGWIHGQEEVSSLPVSVLDPSPGDRVMDLCAAPGSKTSQLAIEMQDSGLVVGNDDNIGRLGALRSNTERLGLTCVAVTNQDGRNYSLKPFSFDSVDHCLVDAPCSGEGTVRKNPAVLDDWSEAFVTGISSVQEQLLRRAVQMTSVGGTVVYSTCTFAPEENEAVLDSVLEEEPCSIVPFELPIATRPGIRSWQGETFHQSVERAKRVYPHLNDTGGFFCAKLRVDA